MDFELLGEFTEVEPIAVASSIRELPRLNRRYGQARWRKMEGVATIRPHNGRIRLAEIHWYEAHGIGREELKRKRYLD